MCSTRQNTNFVLVTEVFLIFWETKPLCSPLFEFWNSTGEFQVTRLTFLHITNTGVFKKRKTNSYLGCASVTGFEWVASLKQMTFINLNRNTRLYYTAVGMVVSWQYLRVQPACEHWQSPPQGYIKDISCFLYIFEPKSRQYPLMNNSYEVFGHFCSCLCYTVLDMQQNVPGWTFSISWLFISYCDTLYYRAIYREILERKVEQTHKNTHTQCRGETALAQWLGCCVTNRKVAGSIPAGVIGSFHKILSIVLWPWGRISF